jgi:hypothetical protein
MGRGFGQQGFNPDNKAGMGLVRGNHLAPLSPFARAAAPPTSPPPPLRLTTHA